MRVQLAILVVLEWVLVAIVSTNSLEGVVRRWPIGGFMGEGLWLLLVAIVAVV